MAGAEASAAGRVGNRMKALSDALLYCRAAQRIGAFSRALRAGCTPEDARLYSDSQYPPNQQDLEFETRLRSGTYVPPWGSTIGLLLLALNIAAIIAQATLEVGIAPPLLTILGLAVAQLGYLLLAFGIFKGRFGVFCLVGRGRVVGLGVAALVCGAILVNHHIWAA